MQEMMKLMVADKNLSEALTKEQYAKLEKVLKEVYQLDIKDFETFTLTGIMSAVMSSQLKCDKKMYELEFIQMAAKKKMQINGLELVADQIKSFENVYRPITRI
jgi:uncharacterized protein